MSKVSIRSQIAAVDREISQRRNVYPRLVGSGKMRQPEADLLIEHMEAVRRTLVWLAENEVAVRSSVAASGGRDLS